MKRPPPWRLFLFLHIIAHIYECNMNFQKFVESSTDFLIFFDIFVENSTVFLYIYIFVNASLPSKFYFLHIKIRFPKKFLHFDKIFSKFYLLIRGFVVSYWVEKNYFSNKIFITEEPSTWLLKEKSNPWTVTQLPRTYRTRLLRLPQSTPLLLRR